VNWKKILALALFLAALGVVISHVNRRETGRLAVEGTLLDIPADAIDKVVLRNSGGLFVFSRRDTLWRMEKPLATKADKVALESILDNFCLLKYDRLVAEDGRDLKSFGLDRPGIELQLFARNRPAVSIRLGMKNNLDDSSYATLASGGKVVTIAAYKRNDLEKDLFAFRDKKFLPVDPMAVSALDYRCGENVVALAKKDGRWFLQKPVYAMANDARISDILASASTLEALSFVPAAAADVRRGVGLDKPLLRAEFRSNGVSQRIAVGKKGEEYFAWVEGADEICGIGKDFPDKFVSDAAALREKKVALFYAYDVRELSFRQGTFQFGARKDAVGNWEFDRPGTGKKPGPEKIDALLTALAGLEAVEFIDAPLAMPAVATRIVLKTDDPADPGKQGEIIMEFSAVAGETVIARNPALPYAFKVGKEILGKFPGKIEDIAGEAAGTPGTGK
jgi:hypothetical protein